MLEHAEVSIARAEDLATTDTLALETEEFAGNQRLIEFLESQWPPEALPEDRTRLATTVVALLKRLDIDVSVLAACLAAETSVGRGTATLNLSPYGVLVQSLLNQRPEVFDRLKEKRPRDEFRVFLPREIEQRDDIATKAPDRVVTL